MIQFNLMLNNPLMSACQHLQPLLLLGLVAFSNQVQAPGTYVYGEGVYTVNDATEILTAYIFVCRPTKDVNVKVFNDKCEKFHEQFMNSTFYENEHINGFNLNKKYQQTKLNKIIERCSAHQTTNMHLVKEHSQGFTSKYFRDQGLNPSSGTF